MDASTRGDSAEAGSEAPSLESLVAMAETLAPGMHEVAHGESAVPATVALPARSADACVRAVFGATSPVIAALVADEGRILDITEAGLLATLEARGPVCLRKGQSARIEVQGQAPLVRYVVWMTP